MQTATTFRDQMNALRRPIQQCLNASSPKALIGEEYRELFAEGWEERHSVRKPETEDH